MKSQLTLNSDINIVILSCLAQLRGEGAFGAHLREVQRTGDFMLKRYEFG